MQALGRAHRAVAGSDPVYHGMFGWLDSAIMHMAGIPVVVAGRVVEAPGVGTGLRFEGDEVLVKHDESYDAKNADRVARADDAAAACAAGD